MRITVKGLAKFMTSGSAGQRKILHDFKFPDPEGGVQAKYYAEARRTIEEFHGGKNDPAVIAYEVDRLREKANRETGMKRVRLEHNIRALQSYLENFGHAKFTVLSTPGLSLEKGGVTVSAIPDLYVDQGGRKKLIKLDLSTAVPDKKIVAIVLQVMYEAAKSKGLLIEPKDVLYLDVPRAEVYRGVRVRSRLSREIDAACANIEALWPSIKK